MIWWRVPTTSLLPWPRSLRQSTAREPPITDLDSYRRNAAAVDQSALCLSGGGIRSASFSLGVIQALARAGLLRQFDYLSTVSGGGFIGAWLSMLIAQKGSVAAAEQELRDSAGAPAVAALRDYTDYLTPHVGLLSDDTWAGIVLYLRNVLINWFAFLPVFVLAGAGSDLLSHPAVDGQCEQCDRD